MTNLSSQTRKQLVLAALRSNEWVSTAEIENAQVGGTQGTRRLRELRAEGYLITKRRKANSDQYEYHLVTDADIEAASVIPESVLPAIERTFHGDRRSPAPAREPDVPRPVPERREALSQPFVAWHGETHRGFTAKHRGYSMSVRPFWGDGSWIFVVTRPNGTQEAGRAANLLEAKRAAVAVTL